MNTLEKGREKRKGGKIYFSACGMTRDARMIITGIGIMSTLSVLFLFIVFPRDSECKYHAHSFAIYKRLYLRRFGLGLD